MVTGEPTFAGVTLSQFMQLPKGVTVTLAGAGGQAPIISLDPASLLPPPPKPIPAPTLLGNTNAGGNPGLDTFTNNNPLTGSLGLNAVPTGQPLAPPLLMKTQGEDDGEEKGKGKGKAKGKPGGPPGLMKKGGMPPGLAKATQAGHALPPGNPWSKSLQAQPTAIVPTGGNGTVPTVLTAQPTTLTPRVQSTTLSQPPQPRPVLPNIPGLPQPTAGLTAEPGAKIQLGPPFV